MRTKLMWLTVAVAWVSMGYTTAKTREFAVIVGASLAQLLPSEGEYRITRVENLQALPTVRVAGHYRCSPTVLVWLDGCRHRLGIGAAS